MGHFNTRGLFNKGESEAIDEWKKEGAAQEVLKCFMKVNGSGKLIKYCMKIYDKITKILKNRLLNGTYCLPCLSG